MAVKTPEATPAAPAADAAPKAENKPEATPAPKELALDFVSAPVTLAASLAQTSQPKRSRSEKQEKMDAVAAKAHKTWTDAGRPSQWGAMVNANTVLTYFVDPELSADLKSLITKAAAFHGTRARFGSSFALTPDMVKTHNLPEDHIGREVVNFAIVDKREYTRDAKTTDKPAENGTAPAADKTDADKK